MALDGSLPKVFAYLHPRLSNLVLAAVCAWGVAYILVTISVIALRIRGPDLPRPYKAAGYPLPQIISLAGISTALARARRDRSEARLRPT